jgi:hypothetical protein
MDILRFIETHPRRTAAGTTMFLCAGTVFVYHNHPLAMDEYAAVFQSQVFASGHVSAVVPAGLIDWLVPAPFQNYFLNVSHVTGRLASAYWPSFSLMMTPFTWLGIRWACNPLISGLTVIAIHRVARTLSADRDMAGRAVLLTIASP